MYFNKYPLGRNFSFAEKYSPESGFAFKGQMRPVAVQSYAEGIHRITVRGGNWDENFSQAELELCPLAAEKQDYSLSLSDAGELVLKDHQGDVLLESFGSSVFGKCGEASLFRFKHESSFRYYGMGSKLFSLEHTGRQTKFWNTDAWADFAPEQVADGTPDPYYISIPYLIIKTPNAWVGLLYHNPEAAFISIAAEQGIENITSVQTEETQSICIGSESGQPDLFILAADSLDTLTQEFQSLVGRTPLPPLWAIGYQQCRWGYKSFQELEDLKQSFDRTEIPVSGLWLDIDYMDAFRVFTFNSELNPDPKASIQALRDKGHPVVPIIDPGVKMEPGYSVYDSGKANDIFCQNPEGEDFVGLVWPGQTVFPDFSRESGRTWWADQVESFAKLGFTGAWLDMNDPSVGKSNPYDMRWGDAGVYSHEKFHNQYGMLMAKATREGFERAHPDQRIFLLSRSSCTVGSRYSAVWTGDNISSYRYLRQSVATSLNLALSGIPFNGADVGGFGRDTSAALLSDWTKAACLMPFFRNHSELYSIDQEPWVFGEKTLEECRNFIRLRYRLLPYLYQLFHAQATTGAAIVRPLLYDFESTEALPIDCVDDAFLIGPSILQAPFLDAEAKTRTVPLPGDGDWYDPMEDTWQRGGQSLEVSRNESTTPLYFREGSLLPLSRGMRRANLPDLLQVDLLLIAHGESEFSCEYSYLADDGETLQYQQGVYSEIRISAKVASGAIQISVDPQATGYGRIQCRLLLLEHFDAVHINGNAREGKAETVDFAGKAVTVQAYPIES